MYIQRYVYSTRSWWSAIALRRRRRRQRRRQWWYPPARPPRDPPRWSIPPPPPPRDLLTRRLDAATASSSSRFDLHGHAAATATRAARAFDVYAASCCKSLSSAAFTRTSYTSWHVPRTQACIPTDPFRYPKNIAIKYNLSR